MSLCCRQPYHRPPLPPHILCVSLATVTGLCIWVVAFVCIKCVCVEKHKDNMWSKMSFLFTHKRKIFLLLLKTKTFSRVYQQQDSLIIWVKHLLNANSTSGSFCLACMTVTWGYTISSTEVCVYQNWACSGEGIVHWWHFIFSVPLCHFGLLPGGKFWNVFSFSQFSLSKQNSDSVVVGGLLKWTPQRPLLGKWNCFRYGLLSHISTVHINDQWRSTTL